MRKFYKNAILIKKTNTFDTSKYLIKVIIFFFLPFQTLNSFFNKVNRFFFFKKKPKLK